MAVWGTIPTVTRVLVFALSMLLPAISAAEEIRELRVKPTADLAATFGMAAFWIGSELDKENLAAEKCRWCDPPGLDAATRRALKWENTERAADLSDYLDFAGMPLLMLGGSTLLAAQHDIDYAWEDSLIIVESAMAAAMVNQIVKLSVARQRPYAHHGGTVHDPHDDNLSFYSGHASLAFALATSTATVATMRGYDNAWVVWPVGLSLATTVAWLRIAADKHWLTDVTTGAALGTAAGVLVPLLLHPPRRERTSTGTVIIEAQPPMLVATFVF